MLRLAYGIADQVVAVSHGQAQWLQQAKLLTEAKLVVIPNACDAGRFEAVPALTQRAGPLRLGAYGRFVPQKGFDLLIEAMRLVPPLVATLRLAGAGQDEASLLLAARDLAHVSVEGPFAQPQGFLEDIEAIIVPSRWEAYGLVAAEARAAGRPVLSGAVDGLIEQIIPECGSLGALDAPQSIAAAIIAFAAQDICAMGEAARRSTSGAFDATIAGWAGLLQSPQKTMKFAR
jgi:glycosyltransferase involved in cell wall biosynthesis